MLKFSQADLDDNDDAKAIAIPQVFSENSRAKQPFPSEFMKLMVLW